jgi:hypothetical protein
VLRSLQMSARQAYPQQNQYYRNLVMVGVHTVNSTLVISPKL